MTEIRTLALVLSAIVVNMTQHGWWAGFIVAVALLAVWSNLLDHWEARVRGLRS